MSERDERIEQRVLDLARAMIRIPSRAGIDPANDIVGHVVDWCDRHDLPHKVLSSAGQPVGIWTEITSGQPGNVLCLNACLDTAAFGDEAKWTHPPTSAVVAKGRLYGRGAADSKIAAAIFLVLASELHRERAIQRGRLQVLLDADEHTGEFRGVKEFVRTTAERPEAVWIGYPGNTMIVAGSRGFLRARIAVHGVAAHTGSKRRKGVNAISRAARLVVALDGLELPREPDPEFSFGPSLNITAFTGGAEFSVVPDLCRLNLDIRLTPGVDTSRIRASVEQVAAKLDKSHPDVKPTSVDWVESWPAFREPDSSPTIACLRAAGERVFGHAIPTTISGPSNIGNFLSTLGIGAMSGFGVTYDNVHAADEWSEVASISKVYEAYRQAVVAFTDPERRKECEAP